MSVSKERMIASLRSKQDQLRQELEPLVSSYNRHMAPRATRKGAIGLLDSSQELAAIAPFTTLSQTLQRSGSWDDQIAILSEMQSKFDLLWANFLVSGDNYLKNRQKNKMQYEIMTRSVFEAMDIMHGAYERMIGELDKPAGKSNTFFGVRYQAINTLQNLFVVAPHDFVVRVNQVTEAESGARHQQGVVRQRGSLKEEITRLNVSYNEAYTNTHTFGFWRWIKTLFQKTDRAEGIEFLTNLSEARGCTDDHRKAAIALVHGKIFETEVFARGSKLALILRSLCPEETKTLPNLSRLKTFMQSRNIYFPLSIQSYIERKESEQVPSNGPR